MQNTNEFTIRNPLDNLIQNIPNIYYTVLLWLLQEKWKLFDRKGIYENILFILRQPQQYLVNTQIQYLTRLGHKCYFMESTDISGQAKQHYATFCSIIVCPYFVLLYSHLICRKLPKNIRQTHICLQHKQAWKSPLLLYSIDCR